MVHVHPGNKNVGKKEKGGDKSGGSSWGGKWGVRVEQNALTKKKNAEVLILRRPKISLKGIGRKTLKKIKGARIDTSVKGGR